MRRGVLGFEAGLSVGGELAVGEVFELVEGGRGDAAEGEEAFLGVDVDRRFGELRRIVVAAIDFPGGELELPLIVLQSQRLGKRGSSAETGDANIALSLRRA